MWVLLTLSRLSNSRWNPETISKHTRSARIFVTYVHSTNLANIFFCPEKLIICKRRIKQCLLHLLHIFDSKFTVEANTTAPDQTAPKGAVLSGSILFAIQATKHISILESR